MPPKKRPINTPPKAKDKRTKQSICLICDATINDENDGDDSIFCDGICQGWLHRRCVCLSKSRFKVVGESDDPFYCPSCMLYSQAKELSNLKEELVNLQAHVAELNDLSEMAILYSHPFAHTSKNISHTSLWTSQGYLAWAQ